jgi:hypothetical protein
MMLFLKTLGKLLGFRFDAKNFANLPHKVPGVKIVDSSCF